MSQAHCPDHAATFALMLDGVHETPDVRALRDHVESCSACRAEYDWLLETGRDLERLGERIVRNAPDVDVVDAVMAEIRGARPQSKVVPMTPRGAPPRDIPWGWMATAAAAGFLAAAALFLALPQLRDAVDSHGPPQTAQQPGETIVEPRDPSDPDVLNGGELAAVPSPTLDPDTSVEAPGEVLSSDEIFASYRDAMGGDAEARRRLITLAMLDAEEAEALLMSGTGSAHALAGAAPSLSNAQAAEALLQAIGRDPENAYLRYRLALTYGETPEFNTDAREQAVQAAAQDPENALPYYLLAQELLAGDPPDVAGALEALDIARLLDTASPYTLEGALAREQALIASGVNPATARLLSAFTAGAWEYEELNYLASNLMAYGDQFRAAGDLQTANELYEAALDLGRQLDAGAMFSQERLAALDIQREALGALEDSYTAQGREQEIQQLRSAAHQLAETAAQFAQYFDQLDTLLSGFLPGDSRIGAVASSILTVGDLNIFQFLADILAPAP